MAYLINPDPETNPGAKQFTLASPTTVLGRHPDCDILVEAGAVSRHHAKISQREQGFFLEDLGSRNGTFLNGQLINGPQLLTGGDRVRICDTEFEFRDSEPLTGFEHPSGTWQFDGSSFGVVMVDDQAGEDRGPAISSVEVKKSASGVHVSASVETKLAAFLQISRALGAALRLDEVLPKVLESLFAIFPQADRGFIVMVESDGQLIPRWAKTRRPQGETETLRISRTIVRQVMADHKAICSLDASSDQRFQSSESIADFRIRSMICAPLINSEGEAIGALQIDTCDQRNRFDEKDVEVLEAVAVQAGIAIHNARLHEQALHQKEVEQDLKLAKDVQAAFLPQSEPAITGFRFFSHYSAANQVGGDYYDYITLPNGKVGVVVADVVGHGVAAAMFMAKLSAETRFALASEACPARAVEILNNRLSDLGIERFVTFLLIVLDPSGGSATIVNAGHMPPVIRRATGEIEEPGAEESGLPIGIISDCAYEPVEVQLNEGDTLALYTDGVNEAMDASGQLFGIDKIRQLVKAGGNVQEVSERVITEIQKHFGDRPQDDDLCLVVIQKVQPDAGPSTMQMEPAVSAAT